MMMIHITCDMCLNDYTLAGWQETEQLSLSQPESPEYTFCSWPCLGEFTLNTLNAHLHEPETVEEEEPEEDEEVVLPGPSRNGHLKPARVRRSGDVERDGEREYTDEDEALIPRPQGVQIDSIKIKR